jgi:hypothetical protein
MIYLFCVFREFCADRRYSLLSVIIGSTRVARRPGR